MSAWPTADCTLAISRPAAIQVVTWSCPVLVDIRSFGRKESTMSSSQKRYPAEFKRQMVELVRAGRTPNELAREFEPSAESIRNWVKQAERGEGKHSAGLSSKEIAEQKRLRGEKSLVRYV